MKLKFSTYNSTVGFNDLPFMIIGIPVLSIIVSMMFFGLTIKQSVVCFGYNPLAASFATATFWLGDRMIIGWVRKKYPDIRQDSQRLYLQLLLVFIFTVVMSIALYYAEPFFDKPFLDRPHPGYVKSLITCLFATALVSAIYEAAYYIHRWKESIAETERIRKEHTMAQLESLRNQVNPHFLFNSLNTLASIIPEDPNKSVEFVQKLSSVYRCILDINDKGVVTLEEELGCLKNYIFLLETRFESNLQVDLKIDDSSLRKHLAPMSLQMLLENVIKHNVISQKRPLKVLIMSSAEEVVVENVLQIKDQVMDKTGTGLNNIQNRYRLLFDRTIEIYHNDELFRVTLPLIEISDYHSLSDQSFSKRS